MEFDMDAFFAELNAVMRDNPLPGNADGLEIEDPEAECEVLQ